MTKRTAFDKDMDRFKASFKQVSKYSHSISISHGFDTGKEPIGEQIALMHCELSEAVEAAREGNPKSKKIPNFSCIEEELADVILRIMGFSRARELDVAGALIEKLKYNKDRPFKHGKLF